LGATVLFSSCNNLADATSENYFRTLYSITGGTLSVGNRFRMTGEFQGWTPASGQEVVTMYANYGTVAFTRALNLSPVLTTTGASAFVDSHWATLIGSGSWWSSMQIGMSGDTNANYNGIAQPVSAVTSGTQPLGLGLLYNTHGIAAAVCNDAGNACGLTGLGSNAAGTTVNLQTFNGTACTGVLGTAYLTGTGAIANGTPIYITNTGKACTATATSAAYVAGGTATGVSGSVTITSTLGAMQGNAVNLGVFSVVKEQ
jgi:hypothetical protein